MPNKKKLINLDLKEGYVPENFPKKQIEKGFVPEKPPKKPLKPPPRKK